MNNVNKTLYIPLYAKALVSKRGLFIKDERAERIWETEGFALKGKAKSKWLAYYLGIRAAVFDDWVKEKIKEMPDAAVVHIGCGLDSRVERVGAIDVKWYDVDFADVIEERKRYYKESINYKMIAGDARKSDWLSDIPEKKSAIVVMEGVSMYLTHEELQELISSLSAHFKRIALLMDCYSVFAAKMSKYKNPINDVGVTRVYGTDSPKILENDALAFKNELNMTPQKYIDELSGLDKNIFKKLYAGGFSKKLYRLFEYSSK